MKSFVFPLLAIAGLATAHGQTAKPGTISPVLVEATIITENAPTTGNVQGGVRKTYTTSSVRFINRDILEAMRVANLLDGTLTGWTIQRLANPSGVGNVYATKPGKTAVAVPATLLTQPVAQGTATTGTEFTPTGGATKPTLFRRVSATLNVKNGASSAFGTQTVKSANFKAGSTTTPVVTITENYNLTGKSGTGVGVLVGSYRVTKAKPADLSALLPGNAVP
ncbi:hypothetical protein OKA04_07455 [Luteolibacter flavescens]|uniref:WxL domain-containing protein n=1 Tax=Luteolibacter flavescens TaxID=1859460 RepID=A0ABT3FMI8_9BACT|nr:hypothetical protein [Luteolibacter flavescens]MCW1884564.1 hypothetical protein [Luteolibacter flavescens]